MSAMTAKTQEIVGKDQDGRDVYADKSVVVPGSLRPDGTRRKDLRVRAEQRPDGSWRSFVPQDEVKKYAVRARRRLERARAGKQETDAEHGSRASARVVGALRGGWGQIASPASAVLVRPACVASEISRLLPAVR